MNFRTASKEFLDLARRYEKDMDMAREYYDEIDIKETMKRRGVDMDTRDFLPMIILMGIQGETEEERNKDIREKLNTLMDAFADPDVKKREEYLAMIYYMVDDFANDFDPVTMNMSDPVAVEKLLKSMLISQTIAVKREENPEYFKQRYSTPEQRNLENISESFMMTIGSTVTTLLEENGIKINVILSLPKPLEKEIVEIHNLEEEYRKAQLDEAKRTKGALSKEEAIDFPILDSLIPSVGKNVRDISKFTTEQFHLVKNYYTYLVESSVLLSGSQNTQGLKDAGIGNVTEAVYVDGKPYKEFEKQYLKEKGTGGIEDVILGVCVLGAKHKVDIVQAFPNEAGEMQYSAKTMRFAVTPQQEEQYMQQFSWIRRNLFNWWIFRIEPLQEKIDRMINDPEAETRRASVLEMHKRKIEEGLVRNAENWKQVKLNSEREAKRRENFNEVNDRLIGTVAQWDKESVIGILGQQIAANYDFGESSMEGAYKAIRKILAAGAPKKKYDKMSTLFAKVVLYAQLCGEREANGGEPGAVEKALGAGASVQDNIEKTAVNMANDPIFKKLLLDKIGESYDGELAPERAKYERLLIGGGCATFMEEYKQRMKAAGDNQKEQPAPAKDKQQAKKEAKAQKIPG